MFLDFVETIWESKIDFGGAINEQNIIFMTLQPFWVVKFGKFQKAQQYLS